ncbi:MAG: cysteine desulfurase NifS [Acetobacteraceae bacterium]|nr:cysteine desulfurase NifS [Acetobacteraceae bacterium]
MRRVYLDHAATTPVHPQVAKVAVQYMTETFGNPSSIHCFGREARQAVEGARATVASLIGAQPEEIYFTSGGTEADNLAIQGVALAAADGRGHIITSQVEHHAVLHTCEFLEKRGFDVTYLPVDGHGMVDPDQVARAIRKDTVLITVMLANNEVGTIQPIADIARLAREKGVPVHTDAVQAAGNIPVDVNRLGVDLMSLSSHKIYGPKGTGALYVRRGTRISPTVHGGAHERGLRAGTENVPGILAMAKASELAQAEMPQRMAHVARLRDRFLKGLMEKVPDVRLNGHPTARLPNNASVSVLYVEGESVLLNLDLQGIAASSGSACTSGRLEPSHVLVAMGIPHDISQGSLRFSFGRGNTEEDVDYVLEVLPSVIARLRAMSPLGPGKKQAGPAGGRAGAARGRG